MNNNIRHELVNIDGTSPVLCAFCGRMACLSMEFEPPCCYFGCTTIRYNTDEERKTIVKGLYDEFWVEMKSKGIEKPENHVLNL